MCPGIPCTDPPPSHVALRSVRLLQEELAGAGVTSKRRVGPSGREFGGKPFARGALYILLQNRLYLGEITHKDRHYPGQHTGIVDDAVFELMPEPKNWGRLTFGP